MAYGFVNGDREERAKVWDSHADANTVRAREARAMGNEIGRKIASDCDEAAKVAQRFAKEYRK
jgi:hypothetical protein